MENTKVKASYTLFNGKVVEVEVTTQQAKVLNELARQDYVNKRRETRRHQSLDCSVERGFQLADERVNIESDYIKREQQEYLHSALNKLNQSQRELVVNVFFNGALQTQLAKKMGVSKAAVQNKLKRIYKQLKKDL